MIRGPKATSPEELLNVRLETFKTIIATGGSNIQLSFLIGGQREIKYAD